MIGKTFTHYRILDQLGGGGMGVVYRAEDIRLGRHVALKILPEQFAADRVALERFQREARTASALNHPHICAIYDIGESEGRPFLVMELLDGQSLSDRLAARRQSLDDLLEIGIQIADALVAAHSKGIVHRDVKPGNIFIGPADPGRAGHVKVLDFGLAKVTGPPEQAAAATQAATAELFTSPGTAVGTIAYMSPEQALGHDLDARTDLFSFGVVLYQMATGTLPFTGLTSAATFDGILNKTPPPPSQLNPALPAALDAVILKALEKDRDIRYQSAADLRADLKRLVRDATASGKTPVAAAPVPARTKLPIFLYAAIAAVAALAAAFLIFRGRTSAPHGSVEWVQLTTFADSVTSPALSADGRVLTFLRGPSTFFGPADVYVKILPDGEPAQLTNDRTIKMSPVISPDGSRIAYTVHPTIAWDTFVVPLLGGTPRQMLANAEGLVWIGPHTVLFSEIKSGTHMAVVTAEEGRANQRDVYVPPHERGMGHRSYLSPDRKNVLVVEMDNEGWLPCRVLPFDGSSAGRQVGPPKGGCTYAAWSPDGEWMYLNSNVGGSGYHIWRQRFNGGEPEQITAGPTEQEGIAIASDGRSLISSVGLAQNSIWLHDAAGERQLTSEESAQWPTFSTDGKTLYYMSGKSGFLSRGELSRLDIATGRSEKLVPGVIATSYNVSPDDKLVAYSAPDPDGHSRIWIAPLDRRVPPRQLPGTDLARPVFTPDGDIVFIASEGSVNYLYRAHADGSDRQKVTPDPVISFFRMSPDGQWAIAWVPMTTPDPGITSALQAYPMRGGPPVPLLCQCSVGWSTDMKAFYFVTGRALYRVPLAPGKSLPPLPPSGLQSAAQMKSLSGIVTVTSGLQPIQDPHALAIGPTPDIYAITKATIHRNLYRIPLP
jgi:Tol biopolymer transport system component